MFSISNRSNIDQKFQNRFETRTDIESGSKGAELNGSYELKSNESKRDSRKD